LYRISGRRRIGDCVSGKCPYPVNDPGFADPNKPASEPAYIPPPSPAGDPEFWKHVIRSR
jgi:hypothetical protein